MNPLTGQPYANVGIEQTTTQVIPPMGGHGGQIITQTTDINPVTGASITTTTQESTGPGYGNYM